LSISRPRKTVHYINNKDFFAEMLKYKKEVAHAKKHGLEKPKVSEYIGKCLLEIANRLGTKGNFSGYSYLPEMKSDGIENCLMYFDSFNPKKSQNPFAYFTQIIKWAFIRRIHKEHRQHHIKLKNLENNIFNSEFPMPTDLEFLYNDTNIAFLKHQEERALEKEKKTKKKKRALARENTGNKK